MCKSLLMLSGCLLLMLTTSANAGGKLQSLRNEVRTESPAPPSNNSADDDDDDNDHDHSHHHAHIHAGAGWSSRSDSCDDDEDDIADDLTNAVGSVFLLAITSPWWGPNAVLESGHYNTARFPEHPYDNVPGSLVIMTEPKDDVRSWLAEFRTEFATDFDGLDRIGGKLLLDTSSRFGLDVEWNVWEEDMANGFNDSLWTGETNLVYRFAQNEHVQFRSGLGVAWMHDSFDTNFGFNSTYAVDVYPHYPWALRAEFDLGKLGRETRTHFRATAGVVFSSLEFYTGYDIFKVGSTELQGMVFGLQVWY